jgi:DNA-binding transcriptional LysR family regulator
MMADRYLAPHFAQFCSMHPEIELRLLTPFQPMDLTRHEAEVAIRVSDNPPETLIGRRLLTFAMGAYAAPHFLDRLPANPDPAEVDWIGWESDSYNRRMISNYFPTAKVFHRVDSLLVLNSLVRAGMGASVFPCYWADTEAGLRRVYRKPISDDTLGLWVLVHPDARRAAKVRAFTDFISNAFQADRDLFEGLRPTSR